MTNVRVEEDNYEQYCWHYTKEQTRMRAFADNLVHPDQDRSGCMYSDEDFEFYLSDACFKNGIHPMDWIDVMCNMKLINLDDAGNIAYNESMRRMNRHSINKLIDMLTTD